MLGLEVHLGHSEQMEVTVGHTEERREADPAIHFTDLLDALELYKDIATYKSRFIFADVKARYTAGIGRVPEAHNLLEVCALTEGYYA